MPHRTSGRTPISEIMRQVSARLGERLGDSAPRSEAARQIGAAIVAEGYEEDLAKKIVENCLYGTAAENKRCHDIEALALPGHENLLARALKNRYVTPEMFAKQLIVAMQRDAIDPAESAGQSEAAGVKGANSAAVERITSAGRRPQS